MRCSVCMHGIERFVHVRLCTSGLKVSARGLTASNNSPRLLQASICRDTVVCNQGSQAGKRMTVLWCMAGARDSGWPAWGHSGPCPPAGRAKDS